MLIKIDDWSVFYPPNKSANQRVKMLIRKFCDRTKWYIGQNGTNKMVSISIDSNSTELNFYLVTTIHK